MTLRGIAQDWGFGTTLSAGPDIDQDGHSEILVGIDYQRVSLFSGRSGMELLRIIPPSFPVVSFGENAQFTGDINADGIPDIVLSEPENSRLANRAGAIMWFSGKAGSLVRVFYHDATDDVLGNIGLVVVGDADGDAVADVVASGRGAHYEGVVLLLSGRTGTILHTWRGSAPFTYLGEGIAPAGDVDRDACADIAMRNLKEVLIVSGRTSGVLLRITIPQASYASPRANVGDVDRDGWSDVALQAQFQSRHHVVIVSARTGEILRVWRGDWLGDGFGASIAGAGDVDSDGAADIIVGAPALGKYPAGPSYARLVSGGSGRTLFTITETDRMLLADHVASGDVDADGVPDVILSAESDFTKPTLWGSVRVHSCRTLPLSTDVHLLSVGTGGTQRFALEGGNDLAGIGYLLLGSYSGTRPGLDLGGVRLPLNVDAYFSLTLAESNRLILNSLGVLDSQGRATATLRMPPLQASLQGIVLDHAWLGFRLAPWRVGPASNPVPLTLVR